MRGYPRAPPPPSAKAIPSGNAQEEPDDRGLNPCGSLGEQAQTHEERQGPTSSGP